MDVVVARGRLDDGAADVVELRGRLGVVVRGPEPVVAARLDDRDIGAVGEVGVEVEELGEVVGAVWARDGRGVRGAPVLTAPGSTRASDVAVSTSRPARSMANHATVDVAPTTVTQPATAATSARLLMTTA
ncbi:hypothetical protein ASD06_15965 [Angustibacter sp. Root456]|nr:hypothetical protein ASD06_15965 [Angustibacter sp. Root456]